MEPFIENELMQQQYMMSQEQAQAQAQAQAHAQAGQLQSQAQRQRDSVGGQGQGQTHGQGPIGQHGRQGSMGMGQGSLGISQGQIAQMPMSQMVQGPHQTHQNPLHHHGLISQNIGQSHPSMSSNMAPPLPLHAPYKKDFDLLNPSNPSIATAQALLAHDQASQQRYLLHPQYPHMQQVGQYLPPPFPMEVRYDEMMHNQQQHQQHQQQQQQHQQQQHNQQQSHQAALQRHHLALQALQPPGLVAPIPPLHIQQQIVNSETSVKPEPTPTPADSHHVPDQMLRSACLRCKKEFDQPIIIPQSTDSDGGPTKYLAEPKIFKLCQHCRDLQRQRSRRWQKKTKDKQGACRRCGSDIPPEEQKFVLCPSCRQNLRKRKANRAAQGKCVHCLGPLDALIITGDDKKDSSEEKRDKSKLGNYKVCERCRENDKIRRTNLEKMGNCNRCAKALDPMDIGKHKVCANCRSRKKKLNQNINNTSNPGVKVPEIVSHHPGYAVLPPQPVGQPVGLMHDQQAAMAMMTPVSANYTPQQYAQVQYNQAVMQQQAFNQALAQHPQMQQQQQYSSVGQNKGADEYQNAYAVNQ
jgi:hypothetical protein